MIRKSTSYPVYEYCSSGMLLLYSNFQIIAIFSVVYKDVIAVEPSSADNTKCTEVGS